MKMPSEQEYRVEGLPPTIRAKMTEFFDVATDYAFRGSMDDAREAEVYESMGIAKYNLERTIKTLLDRARNAPPHRHKKGVQPPKGGYCDKCPLVTGE